MLNGIAAVLREITAENDKAKEAKADARSKMMKRKHTKNW